MSTRDGVLAGVALTSVAAVGAALFTQYQWGMQPCPWCILQRVIFLAVALVALIGLVWRGRLGAQMASLGVIGLAACGITAALYQHFVAAAAQSCDLTLAERIVSWLTLDERWPEVFTAYASCKDAAVKLFGLSYELWSLMLFVLLALAAIKLLRSPQ